ncbi:hypothetical protein [Streptomyces sp. XD-27]|uniref:hypothetical protein n=1 Tax=Streptomyces sp. XD-27 TaxID=3062779 RepID=UPI0026F468CC|nr:hypothetical protein [Streptomyces sp. XD-27]WKX70640.1 hypothetical protein Q3Y56_12595 [Streptomyces sp. XD-27]
MSGGKGNADLAIDPAYLKKLTQGIKGAIGELREIGSETDAVMGAGFEELSLTSMEAGHNGLAKDFESFVELWEWGVRGLVQDANDLAERLDLAAGEHWEEEKYRATTFKVAANAVAGNPHLSEEEVANKSVEELFSADTYKPDYSAESFKKAGSDIKETWKTTADQAGHKTKLSLPADLQQHSGGEH